MDFRNISKEYRPIPFWSWNEKLSIAETKEQIQEMNLAGIGGFFMHARGGLQTEYMGEEWFDNVTASIEEAQNCGMHPWAYDENGWPSGFGNGVVNGLGVAYQQKYLRMESHFEHPDTAICKCGEHYFYYEINPFYVDTLDQKVVAKFIETAYQPYYERYGTGIEGFFTDEPQISRSGIPWSFVFEEEYQLRYGENILECLEQLFLPVGNYQATRVKFWKMVTELFSSAYMKQIYDWCDKRGLQLTGHLVLEDLLMSQITTNGACMPHYEYFHIPGIDWLGRDLVEGLTAIQVSSVAEQLGKPAVLSETFALCGHNVSFAEMKGIYEWQMVRGVNLLCQHLEGYSIRGIRKRDYPPAMYVQQPWWQVYEKFNDAMSRIGKVLRDGEHSVDVLVLHPQSTVWSLYDEGENKGIEELNEKLFQVIRTLEKKHISFHLGDEILMERHGKVEDGKIRIGKCSYSHVIDPGCEILFANTERLLQDFQKSGGHIVTAQSLPANAIIDNERITYTERVYQGNKVHYFVNTSAVRESAVISVSGKKMDIYTGDLVKFSGVHVFEPWGSLVVLEESEACTEPVKEVETLIIPEEDLRIVASSENSLILDKCDYYFDGELQEKQGYVLNIAERANALERAVSIHQDYFVKIDYIPRELYLVCETPEKFNITINGAAVKSNVTGYFVDKSFRKIEISEYLVLGENSISFDCIFKQSEEFYQNRRKAQLYEGEKNKLVYDMEIEPIYLLGDFQVRTDGKWSNLECSAVRFEGEFVIDKPGKEVKRKHIEQQGYPFFCGELVLEGQLNIKGDQPVLQIDWKGINALKVQINGKEKIMMTNDRLSLKEFEVRGITPVKFTLINNLRNLLGPHHLAIGESYFVGPHNFYREPCLWNDNQEPDWNENYCLVEMGI